MAEAQRGKTLDRLIDLILRVQAGEALPPLVDLARAHGVCPRTIARDVQAIELRLPVRRAKEAA